MPFSVIGLSLLYVLVCFHLVFLFTTNKYKEYRCSFLNVNSSIRLQNAQRIHFNIKNIKKSLRNFSELDITLQIKQFQVMFPSAVWLSDMSAFLVIARIFVNYQQSVVYCSLFDSNWKQIEKPTNVQSLTLPTILPIPVNSYLEESAGPEDARIFRMPNGDICCIFNMKDTDNKRKMFLFSFKSSLVSKFKLSTYREFNQTQKKFIERIPDSEKNWTPLIVNSNFFLVYNFKNFQIIECSTIKVPTSSCTLKTGQYDPEPALIRGGTPFLKFRNTNYYFSFSYAHLNHRAENDKHECAVYRPTLSVVYASPVNSSLMYVYNSEPIEFEGKLFLSPITDTQTLEDADICGVGRIMTLGSIAHWDPYNDVAQLTVNIHDTFPAVIQVKGIEKFISNVIYAKENNLLSFHRKCPELLALHHFKQLNVLYR
jgi:hypothetical protein